MSERKAPSDRHPIHRRRRRQRKRLNSPWPAVLLDIARVRIPGVLAVSPRLFSFGSSIGSSAARLALLIGND